MTERKYAPIDADAVTEQFEEAPPEELAMVRSKLEAAEAKRGIKSGPDVSKMSDGEFLAYKRSLGF
jgi:hypothetical protein